GGGVERCSDDIGRSARQALVEMQTDLLVAAAREQRVYETLSLLTLKERGRQPQRVIAVQVRAHLALIALPPAVTRGCSGTLVLDHRRVALDVPPVTRRGGACAELVRDREVLRRRAHPGEERLPEPARLLRVETLADHRELKSVVGSDLHLLAPMRIEESLGIELEEARQEPAEGLVRGGLDLAPRAAEELRQRVGAQRQEGHDAPAAAAAAIDGPEEIGIRAGVDDEGAAVRRDDLGLEQSRGGRAEALGQTAEAAALDETRDADRGAAAALHVTARLVGDGLIEVDPHGARFRRHGGHGWCLARAAAGDERFVQGHPVHRARPDEERVGRVRGAEVAVAGALHDEAELVVTREIDAGDDIRRVARPDRIDARRRRPGVEPAGNLRARGLIADIEGVMDVGEDLAARRATALPAAGVEERLHLEEIPPDR